jgi:membrane-associated phospholipid phosphatase
VWIPIAGFTVASLTGLMRIYNDRHWTGDVLAGAAVGMICADLTYWLNEKFDSFLAPRRKR